MITIKEAKHTDLVSIRDIAVRSWQHGYKDILSVEQITFMLENIYSISALSQAMVNGQTFYLLSRNNEPVGFIALKSRNSILRIEKLYLVPQVQREGLGKVLIDQAIAVGKAGEYQALELNVNRKNKAYHFYLKQGFYVVELVDIPYYDFVLDDYVMQKALQ